MKKNNSEDSKTSSKKPPTNKAKSNQTVPLVEDEDYYFEKGMMVFTAKYHLKRGECCNSKCRHCPY